MKNNIKLTILLTFFFIGKNAFAQSDSIDFYIKRLSWESFDVFYSFAPKISLRDDGIKILKFEDSEKVSKLINVLSKKQKTVVVHLILSNLFDSASSTFSIKDQYEEKNQVTTFMYNQLTWETRSSYKYSIKRKDIRAIKAYWLKRKSGNGSK